MRQRSCRTMDTGPECYTVCLFTSRPALVQNHSAWWQRQICVNNLSQVAVDSAAAHCNLQSQVHRAVTNTPPTHTRELNMSAVIIWADEIDFQVRRLTDGSEVYCRNNCSAMILYSTVLHRLYSVAWHILLRLLACTLKSLKTQDFMRVRRNIATIFGIGENPV